MFETATTHDIQVEVQTSYVPEQSDPRQSRFFFAYRVRIRNLGSKPVQLLHRNWVISDGLGRIEEVSGQGVVGKQPKIQPNEVFEYESFCPLSTPTGSMRGTYQMQTDDGQSFDAVIPEFWLVEPNSFH